MLCSEKLFRCWVPFYYCVTKPYSCKCLFSTPQIHVATDAFTSTKCESQLVMLHLNLCTAVLVSKHVFSVFTVQRAYWGTSLFSFFHLKVSLNISLWTSQILQTAVFYICAEGERRDGGRWCRGWKGRESRAPAGRRDHCYIVSFVYSHIM